MPDQKLPSAVYVLVLFLAQSCSHLLYMTLHVHVHTNFLQVKSAVHDATFSNETTSLEHKVKQMKGWKKRTCTSCKDLDLRKKV